MENSFYLYSDIASQIIHAADSGLPFVEVSLDLNLSKTLVSIRGDRAFMDKDTAIDLSKLTVVARSPNKVFVFSNSTLRPAEVRTGGYLKLVPTKSAPTLEINGIKMHRSKDIDPLTDARLKTKKVIHKGDVVLDTCGGLGYSAMYALKAGAKKVISTEKEAAVLNLRRLNPWLKTDDRLNLLHADISREISTFEDKIFDTVLHDPPRFCSATGDLYGKPFYTQLNRVMKKDGRLFHYTGTPKRIKERDRFINNTKRRLEQTGFSQISFHDNLQGFTAIKPNISGM